MRIEEYVRDVLVNQYGSKITSNLSLVATDPHYFRGYLNIGKFFTLNKGYKKDQYSRSNVVSTNQVLISEVLYEVVFTISLCAVQCSVVVHCSADGPLTRSLCRRKPNLSSEWQPPPWCQLSSD